MSTATAPTITNSGTVARIARKLFVNIPVSDVQRSIGALRESRGSMCSGIRLLCDAGKTVGERFVLRAWYPAGNRHKTHAITILWFRRAIPRAVERNEHTASIVIGKLRAAVKQR